MEKSHFPSGYPRMPAMEKLRCLRKKLSYPCRVPYIHLYAHLMPTPQCSRNMTDTSCNFPHKLTACNIATGFIQGFESGTLCKHTIYVHPSVRTSHTYLTMLGIPDCHLLQLPTQANSLQHWHQVHLSHSDLPQTHNVWKGCSYITRTYQVEEGH